MHFLRQLKRHGLRNHIPNISPEVGEMLNLLILTKRPKRILEIGCANGYSTIWMAEAARDVGAHITAIDFSAPTFQAAQKNLVMAGLSRFVTFHFGNALEVIPSLPGTETFDFVFVDGEIRNSWDFWLVVQPKLAKNGLVLFDNMLKFPHKSASFFDHLSRLEPFFHLTIPIDGGDGLLLIS